MAITIHDQPQLIAPASNPLVFTFSSTETAQDNFSFIVEVFVDSTMILTQQVFRQFNALSRIDVSGAIETYIRNTIPTTSLELDATDSMVTYAIIVYEKYGDPEIIQASATSTTLKAFNGSLEYEDWINFNYAIYDPNQTQDAFFLTFFPLTSKRLVGMDENFYVAFFEQTAVASCDLNIELLDISGTTIATDFITLTATDFYILNVGPQVIIDNTSITQIDFDTCYRYVISVSVQGVSFVGPINIYMDLACQRYEPYRLHWLNKLGCWDSFTFGLVSTNTASLDSFDYERDPGVWSGNSYTYPLYSGQKINYTKKKNKQLSLNSDFITPEIQNWLVTSLYDSPVVYLERDNGTDFEIVKVTNKNYKLKTRRTDGLLQEEILIERTYIYRSQLN
tara:strand:+ start:3065 stop:4246 length:1182 start_codon:yes stop_codon:yes gene_type:complete